MKYISKLSLNKHQAQTDIRDDAIGETEQPVDQFLDNVPSNVDSFPPRGNESKKIEIQENVDDFYDENSYMRDKRKVDGVGLSSIRDHASNYDYCMILPSDMDHNAELAASSVEIIHSLKAQAFDVFIYRAVLSSNFIVLIKCQLHRLRAFATFINYPMLLDPQRLKDECTKGNIRYNIRSFDIAHRPDITKIPPYDHIFVKYSDIVDENLYWKSQAEKVDHPFRELIRLKLIPQIIESKSNRKHGVSIGDSIRNGKILGFFPLHNQEKLNHILKSVQNYPFQRLNIDEIKEYLGEKIALHFAFIEHVASFMLIPALIGIPLQIVVYVQNNYSGPYLPIFSYFISLWSIFMLEVSVCICLG